MLCPVCKTELVVTGQERLETLSDHVCDPNGEVSLKDKYECLNKDCQAYEMVIWDASGGLYSNYPRDSSEAEFSELFKKSEAIEYIDDNDGPFGSYERQANVEGSKHDEDHILFGITTRWGYIEVFYRYKSNTDGDILSRKRAYRVWRRDKKYGNLVQYTSGIHMFLFVLRSTYNKSQWKTCLDKEDVYPKSWDKRWWSLSARWCCRVFLRVFKPQVWKQISVQ